MSRTIIGIDFGSTQSAVSYMNFGAAKEESPQFIKYKSCYESIPTMILLDSGDQDTVLAWGYEINDFIKNDASGKYLLKSDFKRELGQNEAANKCCQKFIEKLSEMIRTHFGNPNSALDFENYEVIFSVPISWDVEQKNLIKKYAVEAGLPCRQGQPPSSINTLPEPFAAIHAIMDKNSDLPFKNVPEDILVVDFGGGTLDTCIVHTDSLGRNPRVVTTYGDMHLGGKDFDLIIRKMFSDKYSNLAEINVTDEYDKIDIENAIRRVKENISSAFKNFKLDKQDFSIHVLEKNYQITVSRGELNQKFSEIEKRIRFCIASILRDASDNYNINRRNISRVVLSGGSSRWYIVKEIIKECLDCDNGGIFFSTETPELDVAKGLSIYAGRNNFNVKRDGEFIKCFIDIYARKVQQTFDSERILPQSDEHRILLAEIGTKYFDPYYITIKRTTKQTTEYAVVKFFARSNNPMLKVLRSIKYSLTGKNITRLQDKYQIYLLYKENGNIPEYYLEIWDAEYAAKAEASNANDSNCANLPDGKKIKMKLFFGKMMFQQNFGTGKWLAIDLTDIH